MPNVAGPIVNQGPMTTSAPLNLGLGAGGVGLVNGGVIALQNAQGDPPWANGMAILLNLIMQPLKKLFPVLKNHEVAIAVMLLLAFVLAYFLIFHGDSAKALINCGEATLTALGNYKGDKASGLNILPPAPDK